MPDQTPNYQIPHPSATDPIAQGAETIRQGTERIDSLFGGAGIEHLTNIGSPTDSGWGMAGLAQEAWIHGPWVRIYFEVRRAGPDITGSPEGGLGDNPMMTISDPRLQTPRVVTTNVTYLWGGSSYGGSAEFWGATLVLIAITAGTVVSRNTTAGEWSVRGSFSFLRP